MPRKKPTTTAKQLRVRLDAASTEYVEARLKEGRFKTIGSYLQWLVWKERTGQDSPMAHLEQKLSQTLVQLQEEIQAVHLSAEGNSAFLHALAKHLLVTLPELEGEERDTLLRSAPKRYQLMLTNAGKELALRIDEGGVDAPR